MKTDTYLRLIFKVEVLELLEEANVNQLLEKYREEGKAELTSSELLTLTDDEVQVILYGPNSEPAPVSKT